jgi:anti-anti-sigma regulatory factor
MGSMTLEALGERWTVVIRGKLDERTGLAVREALRARVDAGEDPRQIMFDLRDVDDYDVLGRSELTSAHRIVAALHRRCAYVSPHARIRGLAILAIHEVQDPNARPVTSLDQGHRWLAEGRLNDAGDTLVEQGFGLGIKRRS